VPAAVDAAVVDAVEVEAAEVEAGADLAAAADMSARDHGEGGAMPRLPRLPRPGSWLRWIGWAVAHHAYTRHHLASYLRMARASLRNPSLRFEGPCFIGPDVRFEVREGYARLVVGAYAHFGAHSRLRAHEGTLRIGAKTVVGIRNTVNCWLDIEIGDACLFGDDVYVCDFDHRADSLALPIKDQGIVKSPVRIGDDVWLGTKVVITRGSDIGAHSVVGASAVARGVYPPRSVVVGQPGRVVKTRA
jgi:acetyltransferase-like isoleucine patch superfamily enzyme